MILTLGIDAGNYRTKTAGGYGVDSFRSSICGWFERNIDEDFGEDDMEFVFNGRKGFAGTLASYEDAFDGGAVYGETKVNDDTPIRILLAIHRYTEKYCPGFKRFNIVVGQPIITHKPKEKQKIIDMLKKTHVITVNRKEYQYTIENVGIAAEGSGAYLASPKDGQIRIIDVGSGTVNCATINNNRHINKDSNTFNYGVETSGGRENLDAISRGIINSTSKLRWRNTDEVLVCGGVSGEIVPMLGEHFSNIQVMIPILSTHNGRQALLPTFSNAVGFYEIARLTYS